MQYSEDFINAADGHEIPVRMWRPKTVDKILVISHGMAEYCERYAPLADWLTESNIAVLAMNHRGHGMDCPEEDLGYFADEHGWQKVVDDVDRVIDYARKEIPDTHLTLFGHSMGSFIAQSYFQRYPEKLDQVIFCGSNLADKVKLSASMILLAFIKFYKGKRGTSNLVNFLSFGMFNRRFKPNRTSDDWLSRDEEQVDAYHQDPYCGFSCSILMWQDFIGGMLGQAPATWSAQTPIHLLSGSEDGVGDFGKGVPKLAAKLRKAGKKLVTVKLYPGARHELVNETNAQEVWQDIRALVLHGQLDG